MPLHNTDTRLLKVKCKVLNSLEIYNSTRIDKYICLIDQDRTQMGLAAIFTCVRLWSIRQP